MKFKVGDRVEAIKKEPKGKIGTIVRIWSDNCGAEVVFDDWKYGWGENGSHYNVQNDEIKLIKQNQFTKSDLKDGDIVTQRDGYQKVVCAGEKGLRGINECTYLQMENYTTNLLDKDKDTNFDIIKVERPTGYETVFERKEEILDEVEKRYLRDVIRPFSEDIENIRKITVGKKECLMILFKDGDTMSFKNFKKGAMYKNMEADRSYTLEELGL